MQTGKRQRMPSMEGAGRPCQYPSLDPALLEQPLTAAPQTATATPTVPTSVPLATASSTDSIDDDDIPTDAQATVMLLRSQLYPDPAAAAAAAAAAKQTRHAKRSRSAPGPSKATAAAVAAAAAAATAARQLPPIILKSQLYTVLADRTAVDRDLEELRRAGKAKLFKLGIGADEYVVLLMEDYCNIIDSLIAKHSQLAEQLRQEEQQRLEEQRRQQQQQKQQQQQQQRMPGQQQAQQPSGQPEAQEDDGIATSSQGSSADHAAMAHTLHLFRSRVLPNCQDSHITCSQLLQLLQTGPAAAAAAAATVRPQQQLQTAAAAASSAAEMQRQLLSAEVVCRDGGVQDSYKFTVPGAAAFVKSVVAGRQELLQLLSRKKYQEVLEKELCCVKLRGSCLTPTFHLKDLQGRGLVTCSDTTAGKLVRLVKRK